MRWTFLQNGHKKSEYSIKKTFDWDPFFPLNHNMAVPIPTHPGTHRQAVGGVNGEHPVDPGIRVRQAIGDLGL